MLQPSKTRNIRRQINLGLGCFLWFLLHQISFSKLSALIWLPPRDTPFREKKIRRGRAAHLLRSCKLLLQRLCLLRKEEHGGGGGGGHFPDTLVLDHYLGIGRSKQSGSKERPQDLACSTAHVNSVPQPFAGCLLYSAMCKVLRLKGEKGAVLALRGLPVSLEGWSFMHRR